MKKLNINIVIILILVLSLIYISTLFTSEESFLDKYPGNWKIVYNEYTGTPHRIIGSNIDLGSELVKDNIESVTRGFLASNENFFKADTSNLFLVRADYDPPLWSDKQETGTWYVTYIQKHEYVPVEKSIIKLIITDGKVTSIGIDYYPKIDVLSKPSIMKEAAVEIANNNLGVVQVDPISIELVVFPIEENVFFPTKASTVEYRLAWKLQMPFTTIEGIEGLESGEWLYIIDAHSGEIIDKINQLHTDRISGHVRGSIFENTPHERAVLRGISDEYVNVTERGVPFSDITDESANYDVSGLAGTVALTANLIGPHVEVYNDGTVLATHYHEEAVPAVHNWNWADDDTSYKNEETNAFYHVNIAYDFFTRGDPFDIDAAYGLTPYPIPVIVNSSEPCLGSHTCNACAGSSGLIFLPAGYCSRYETNSEATSLSSDIIYHEYTHRIVRTVKDYSILRLSPFGSAMNEGFADYYGGSITNDSAHAEWIYDQLNYWASRNMDNTERYPEDWTGIGHYDSEMFAGALWDIRVIRGQDFTDNLVIRAMKRDGLTFHEFVDDMLEADDDNSNISDGTPYIEDICHAFYDNHGIASTFCYGHTELPLADISYPSPTDFNMFVTEDTIVIDGTAAGSRDTMSEYEIEYASYSNPDLWLSDGIVLTGDGLSEVFEDTLGVWDISLVRSGTYTVRLTVRDTEGRSAYTTTEVYIDREMMRRIHSFEGRSSPSMADIDGDGMKEIIFAHMNGILYVLRHDGTRFWQRLMGGYPRNSQAIADINDDGYLEIFAGTDKKLFAYYHNGTNLTGWSQSIGEMGSRESLNPSPAIGDLDGDGSLEIVIGTRENSTVYVFNADGSTVPGWPKEAGYTASTPALADIDGDSLNDIIIPEWQGTIYAWNHNGDNVSGWPVELHGAIYASPAVADINNDGMLEIYVGTHIWLYGLYQNGTPLPAWPINLSGIARSSPAIGDVDGDGLLDIVQISTERSVINMSLIHTTHVEVFHYNGSFVSGWPQQIDDTVVPFSSPVIINRDGNMQIILGTGVGIFAFYGNGSLVEGWPKMPGIKVFSSPSLDDLDGDGDLEMAVGLETGIYLWDLEGTYDRDRMEWPNFHRDIRNTGYYSKPIFVDSCISIDAPGTYILNRDLMDVRERNCIAINSSNVLLDGAGHTIDGVDGDGSGVSIYYLGGQMRNVVVKDLTLSDWFFALDWSNASYGRIENVTATSNVVGFSVHWEGSKKNYLLNNNAYSNENGYWISGSDNNTISNNRASGNARLGLYLVSSNYNTVTGNIISNSGEFGIRTNNAIGNMIYNNIFNNSENFRADIRGNTSWNTETREGTNIVGGPYIGGNYWGKPDGTGYSDTCVGILRTGICLPYELNVYNIDYFPLTVT